MSTQGPHHESLIDSYFDEALTPAQRAAFEQQLRADPALRDQLDLQRRIDDSLRRLFAVPEPAPILAAPPKPRAAFSFRRIGLYAAAAALLVAGIGIYQGMFATTPPSPRPQTVAQIPLRTQYAREVASGFQPGEICTTPEQFEQWVTTNFQQPLRPAETTEGVRFVGWSYARIVSNYSGILLAYVDDQPVLVILDRLDKLKTPPPAGSGPQQIFEKQVNGLVLYEITPFDQARILPLLN